MPFQQGGGFGQLPPQGQYIADFLGVQDGPILTNMQGQPAPKMLWLFALYDGAGNALADSTGQHFIATVMSSEATGPRSKPKEYLTQMLGVVSEVTDENIELAKQGRYLLTFGPNTANKTKLTGIQRYAGEPAFAGEVPNFNARAAQPAAPAAPAVAATPVPPVPVAPAPLAAPVAPPAPLAPLAPAAPAVPTAAPVPAVAPAPPAPAPVAAPAPAAAPAPLAPVAAPTAPAAAVPAVDATEAMRQQAIAAQQAAFAAAEAAAPAEED
jgi:hypothetical protein